jgi:hypothetical protein
MEERTHRVHRKLDVLIKMVLGLHTPTQLAAIHRQASRLPGGGARLRPSAGAAGGPSFVGPRGSGGHLAHTHSSAAWLGSGAAPGHHAPGAAAAAAVAAAAAAGGGGSAAADGMGARVGSGIGGLADQLERVSGPLLHAAPHAGQLPLGVPHAGLHPWASMGHLPPSAVGAYYAPYGALPYCHPSAGLGQSAAGPGTLGGAVLYPSPGSPYWPGVHGVPGGSGGGGGGRRVSMGGTQQLSPAASLGAAWEGPEGAGGSSQHLAGATAREGSGSRAATPHAGGAAPSPFAAGNRGGAGGSGSGAAQGARRQLGGWGAQLRRGGGGAMMGMAPPPLGMPMPQMWPPYAVPIPIPAPHGVRGGHMGGHPLGGLHLRDMLPHSV